MIRGVNISLLTQFWLLQVCGTLDHCFIIYSQIGYISQIYIFVIFRETKHHVQAHVTSGNLYTVPLAARRTQTAA
jgi:hypothetical protein